MTAYKKDLKDNIVHDTAIIYDGATLGSGNVIGPYCIVYPNAEMGNNNKFTSHCSIGCTPQHKEYENNHDKKAIIGSGNIFREFCTIHSGALENTIIGDDNYVMAYCHIPHDAVLGSHITIANNTQIGGHTIIEDYANLGLGVIIHQFSHIGTGAMLGMGTVVPKKKRILPFTIYIGNPANKLKLNQYLISKLNLDEKAIAEHLAAYNKMFSEKYLK